MDCSLVVSGDFHTAYAFDGMWPGRPNTTVEFVVPSVTSANFDELLGQNATLRLILQPVLATVEQTLRNQNPQLVWMDLTKHGYCIVDLKSEQAQCDWFMVDTILTRSSGETLVYGAITRCDTRIQMASQPSEGKEQQDPIPPVNPPVTGVEEHVNDRGLTVLGYGPNPASSLVYVSIVSKGAESLVASVISLDGRIIVDTQSPSLLPGLNVLYLDVEGVPSGSYVVVLQTRNARTTLPLHIIR